jgi:hypothetical protein
MNTENQINSASQTVAERAKGSSTDPFAWSTPSDWTKYPNITADPSVAESWRRDHRQVTPIFTLDENAPWLTTAHIICSDAGIAHGHIADRLKSLRDKLDADRAFDEDSIEALMHKHGLINVAGDYPALEAKLIAFARDVKFNNID